MKRGDFYFMDNEKILMELEHLKQELNNLKRQERSGISLNKAFSKINMTIGIFCTIVLSSIFLYAAQVLFTDGEIISAGDVNANFTELYEKIDNIALEKFYPVGSRYIQFPQTDGSWNTAEEPETKFGGTWEIIFKEEGVFFRTEGGTADEEIRNAGTSDVYTPRTNGIQGDAVRNVSGYLGWLAEGRGYNGTSVSGAFYRTSAGAGGGMDSSGWYWNLYNQYFSASRVVPTASENIVKNRLIRIWERIE